MAASLRLLLQAVVILAVLVPGGNAVAGNLFIHVDDDAAPGGDGVSWDSAFAHLADALVAAGGGGEVRVAAGTYAPDENAAAPGGTGVRSEAFVLDGSVTVRGGYAGLGGIDPDEHDPAAHVTVLTGDLLGNDQPDFVNNGDNAFHVVRTSGSAVLDGCLVTGGNANGFMNDEFGAGVLVEGGAPLLNACTFSRNSAGAFAGGGAAAAVIAGQAEFVDCGFLDNRGAGLFSTGGGLYVTGGAGTLVIGGVFAGNTSGSFGQGGGAAVDQGSALELAGCLVASNTATEGGGLHAVNGGVTLTDCLFAANIGGGATLLFSTSQVGACRFQANTGGGLAAEQGVLVLGDCMFVANTGGNGAGLRVAGSGTVSAQGCSFEGNHATGSGGAVSVAGGAPTISGCTFTENTAGQFGGGLHADSAALAVVTGCTFSSNAAAQGGAWWSGSSIPVTATACSFKGNTASGGAAPGRGGGLFAQAVDATNCAFHGNTAGSGGAVDAGAGSTLVNCSVAANGATGTGGGVVLSGGGSALFNCIAWNNGDGNGAGPDAQVHQNGGVSTVSFSCVQGGWTGVGDHNIDLDPVFLNADTGDLRLGAGSPCIDAGDTGAVPASVELDLAGLARFVDDPDTADTGTGLLMVDIGAFEFQGDTPCPGDVTGDGVVGVNDLVRVITSWGCTGSCAGDTDGNGTVDTDDLVLVLVGWGLCP